MMTNAQRTATSASNTRFGRLPLLSPVAVILLLMLGIGSAAESATAQALYVYKTIDDPNAASPVSGAGPGTAAHGINDAGTIVGVYSSANDTFHAFQFVGGAFTTADFPGPCSFACGTEANAINNLGMVVGDYTDAFGATHGYSEAGGTFQNIDFPGAVLTIAEGVNNNGLIVGFWVDNANVGHGFKLFKGQFTTVDCPGGGTFVEGVNDLGDLVGQCSIGAFKFTAATGLFTALAFPGAGSTRAMGINNVGDVVGEYFDTGSNRFHGFLLSGGNYKTIDPPGSVLTECNKINDQGEIAGDYLDSLNVGHGFLAQGPGLLDPVVDLLDGPAVVSGTLLQALGLFGRAVKGVAADGVTEVVLRIPANNVGDQFTLKLLNDQQLISNLPAEDGALGNPGDTNFSQNLLTVTAIGVKTASGQQVPFAFAVYRAPVDFARLSGGVSGSYKSGSCSFTSFAGTGFVAAAPGGNSGTTATLGSGSLSDDLLACRSVSIQILDVTSNSTLAVPVTILRPPVVMIHGLWDNWTAWNNFNPLVSGPNNVDPRFYVGRVSYDSPVSIAASDPAYSQTQLQQARANSLGFAFNAPNVLAQIDQWIENFKQGNNPPGIPVAAVQADIVAHSMGGDITRTLVLQPTFLSDNTFGQGSTHKVITIDTPHLGSPVARQLVSSQESCLQNFLTSFGKPVFRAVMLSGGGTFTGAIADLNPSSSALGDIANQGSHPLPTALIAGVYTDFSSLDTRFAAAYIRNFECPLDPLARQLTSTGWPAVFNENNDAIVGEASQLNGLSPVFVFTGVVHSKGTEKLGFSSPNVLDPDSKTGIPSTVIFLLNLPVTQASFHPLSP